jgi:hypothetical protein
VDGDFDFVVGPILVEEVFYILSVCQEEAALAGAVVGDASEVFEWWEAHPSPSSNHPH